MSNPDEPLPFTQDVMKLVPAADGYLDLLYRTPEGLVEVFARVPTRGRNETETLRRAALLSAAPRMLKALLDLIEWEQPDAGWDADECTTWRNAFVACADATASNIDWTWHDDTHHVEVMPDGPAA